MITLYIDTSVISHLFHDDAPERKAATQEFFTLSLRSGAYIPFVSQVVIDELGRTKDANLRAKLLSAISESNIQVIGGEDEAVAVLAARYRLNGVVPQRMLEDSLHLAYATGFGIKYLVTWNYRHMAKASTEQRLLTVNLGAGHAHSPRLVTPYEVLVP